MNTQLKKTIRVNIVSDLNTLDQMEAIYQDCLNSADGIHVANTYAYLRARIKSIKEPWRCYFAMENNKALGVMFGTIREKKRFGLNIPYMELGAEHVADPLLATEEKQLVLSFLLKAIMNDMPHCLQFELNRLTPPAFDIVESVLKKNRINHIWHWNTFGYLIDTTMTEAEYRKKSNTKSIREINRRYRRLSEQQHLTFKLTTPNNENDNNEQLEKFLTMENAGWKGDNKSSIRLRPGQENYFKNISKHAAQVGQMRWCELIANDTPIAMMFCLTSHNTIWIPKIAYDENYAVYGPGVMANHLLILDCLNNKEINKIDCISAAAWMGPWKPEHQEYRAISFFNTRWKGRLFYLFIKLKNVIAKLKDKSSSDDLRNTPYR